MASDPQAGVNTVFGRVGPQTPAGDGVSYPLRQDKTGAAVVSTRGGVYREAVSRGNVYVQQTKGLTVTATMVTPLPGTTGLAICGVYNPIGSGKVLSILKVGFAHVSGTPGGPFYLDVAANMTISGATGVVPINALTLQKSGNGVGKGFDGTIVPGATTQAFRTIGGPAAVSLGAGNANIDEFIDGGIEVQPGACVALTAHATGTTNVVSAYIAWEEIPIPV